MADVAGAEPFLFWMEGVMLGADVFQLHVLERDDPAPSRACFAGATRDHLHQSRYTSRL